MGLTPFVADLRIHPIKSLRGISVAAAELEQRGLKNDRRMMLVDESGRFISQREHAALALVDVAAGEDGWIVHAPSHPDLTVPADSQAESIEVTVWQDKLVARRV